MSEELVIEVSTVRCIRCAWIALLACALIAGGAAAGVATLPDSEACLSLMSDLRFESAEYEPAVHHFIATPKGMRYNHDLVMDSACHESMKRQFANANNNAASRRKLQSPNRTFGTIGDVCFSYHGHTLRYFTLVSVNNVSTLVWKQKTHVAEPCCKTYGYLCTSETSEGAYNAQSGDVCFPDDITSSSVIFYSDGSDWKLSECCKKYYDFDNKEDCEAIIVARYTPQNELFHD